MTDHLEIVLRSCPNHVELNLANNHIANIALLVLAYERRDDYESQQRPTRSRDVSVEQCSSLLQRATWTLRQFACTRRLDKPATSKLRDALLAHATHKQCVSRSIPRPERPTPDRPTREFFLPMCMQATNTLYVRPISLRAKLALLSVRNSRLRAGSTPVSSRSSSHS